MLDFLRQSGCARPPERSRLRGHLAQGPIEAARFLLGQHLVRRVAGQSPTVVRIVETEAYLGVGDPAAHAFRGLTERTRPLWGPPGTLYVYFIYGMHYCLNISVDVEGSAGCVLIRAAEPLTGALGAQDCRGPGRLCRALQIDTRMSGLSTFDPGSGLFLREGQAPSCIGVSPRIPIRAVAGVVLALSLLTLAVGAPALDALREGVARATGTPSACSFRLRTGHDCLGCGGTRAFGHVARGRLREGFSANPLGAMVALACGVLALGAAVSLRSGRGRALTVATAVAVVVLTVTSVVHGVMWWRALPIGLAL